LERNTQTRLAPSIKAFGGVERGRLPSGIAHEVPAPPIARWRAPDADAC